MTLQVLEYKENNFLNLLNKKYLPTKPIYTKRDAWLKLFHYSNLLGTRAIRVITNSDRQILLEILL